MQRSRIVPLVLAVGSLTACSSSPTTSSESTASTDPAPATTAAPTTVVAEPSPTTTPSSAPATTAPPVTTAPPTTQPDDVDPDLSADLEAGRSALLTIDDFPDGWEETVDPDDDPEQDELFESMMDECIGEAAFLDDGALEERQVDTGDFAPAGSSSPNVTQNAVVAADLDTALAAMAEVTNAAVPACYDSVTTAMFADMLADPDQTDFPPGTVIGEITVESVPYELPTDELMRYFVSVPVTAGDESVVVFLDVVFLRQGRALSQLTFTGTNERFPQDDVDALVDVAATRLASIG